MKVVQINSTCGSGSTGKICVSLSELLSANNIENYIFYSSGQSGCELGEKYMDKSHEKINALRSRILGNYGFNTKEATKRLIKKIEKINPDIIHLHNLHGHNCNLEMLFDYIKQKQIKVFWTFHDCWAFTGYCPYYDMIGCDKWKNGGCHDCPQKKRFSWFFDRSKYLFQKKRDLLIGLDLTIITPSEWLADQVKQSFLKDYNVKVINNGIDFSVFQPTKSEFRGKYHLEEKFIVLGVAFGWEIRKGLDVFVELSKRLDDRFKIVLVGTNYKIDKQLPDNVISIHRTNNQKELAEIYSAADVFVNPTREENFPTTHLEALACGTPVIAFNTGGCQESIDESCGIVVEKNDITAMKESILSVCEKKLFSQENCLKKASCFKNDDKFKEYLSLYLN